MKKKVLIVGGVAGGASAAARLRRLDEKAEIIMFERDAYISFANCGLPYHIGETIKDRDKLLVQTPEAMKARFNIDVRINSEVTGVDTKNKKVTVNSKSQGLYEESYDYLILSPGAKALRPNIPGIDNAKIFTLRNIPDTDSIKDYVDQKGAKSAVVIGGGYVGVEMAENLRERRLSVTLVEAASHILAPFDSDMVVMLEKELVENGVGLILSDGVKAFKEIGSQVEVTLNSETKLKTDLVILAIGVVPDTTFIKESGLELGPRGHIIVNDRMETNIEGVYAVGDAIEVVDFITKQKTAIPLAGPANKQGRIAADNIAGLNSTYKGTQGTSVIKVFKLTAASTGANEKTLQKANIPYKSIYIHPVSHASYYPGALPMSLKLLFNNEGRVLGAQGLGYAGVDKRIDVIATVIRLNGTVEDLAELELSYAPPFSSAKDPVNMAGFVAQNVLAGSSHVITWKDMEQYNDEDYILVDVRTKEEFNNGHIKGAVNIPVDSLRARLNELDKNKTIVEYCQVGLRGYVADRILSQNGFKVLNVTGGYKTISSLNFDPKKAPENNENNTGGKTSGITIDPDTQAVKRAGNQSGDNDKGFNSCG
ncbi:MAG: FAD-dependent oxidoreductase [Desulfitobacterium hafniense]|nr:FAD-dependent oxidoreductase [Desulfitobacterium hafniense]